MWRKPSELTGYKADGFEIAHGGVDGYVATAERAFNGWKGSAGHEAVMANKRNWADTKWKAIGIGIYGGFATVWFGTEEDKAK